MQFLKNGARKALVILSGTLCTSGCSKEKATIDLLYMELILQE